MRASEWPLQQKNKNKKIATSGFPWNTKMTFLMPLKTFLGWERFPGPQNSLKKR